jgi:tRNA-dependent cyclodipeptide synthase
MSLHGGIKQDSHVLFSISLIQDENPEAQTGEEFNKMANDLIREPHVSKVTLMKADTLQRFRLMLKHGISEDEATTKAKELNRKFDEMNCEKIQELKEKKQFDIIDWDYYSQKPEFKDKLTEIESLYKTDKKFAHAVDTCIENYARKLKRELGETYNHKPAWELMKKYMFEEVTFQIIAAYDDKADFHYEFYKSVRNRAMKYAHDKFVKAQKPGRMKEIHYCSPEESDKKTKTQERVYSIPNNSMGSFRSLFENEILIMLGSSYHLFKNAAEMLQQGGMEKAEITLFLLREHTNLMSEFQQRFKPEEIIVKKLNLGSQF